jgi:ParB family chromosome partitioning protein
LLALPEEVKTMLARGQLEMGHARTLITLPVAVQLEAAQLIITRGLSVRETENLVKRLQTPTTAQQANANMPLAPDILHLQDSLAKQLQMRVAIHHHAKGKGRLVIHYRSLTELNGLMAQFES